MTIYTLTNAFVKITGWLPYRLLFRTRVDYEDRRLQGRRIRGAAMVISNHTSVFDYAVLLFTFFTRTLRTQMAELLFKKRFLRFFLPAMGGIKVDRGARDFGFVERSERILRKGGVVAVFPESRLPRKGEERPLAFVPSAAYLALTTDVPVVPVWTNGSYFARKRARVVVGTPMRASDFTDPSLDDRDNITRVSEAFRTKIIELSHMAEDANEAQKDN